MDIINNWLQVLLWSEYQYKYKTNLINHIRPNKRKKHISKGKSKILFSKKFLWENDLVGLIMLSKRIFSKGLFFKGKKYTQSKVVTGGNFNTKPTVEWIRSCLIFHMLKKEIFLKKPFLYILKCTEQYHRFLRGP